MGFLANFTAIDFETANRRRDSACQLPAVTVREGRIVREQMWMIRPDPFFFSPGNIRIHGIHPADVQDHPTFGELWQDIAVFLNGDCLIAHNAPFDLGVLIGCLERHQHPIPSLHFSCTRLIARQTWPDRGRYGLKPLSDWLGVQFKHHDALEDSRACAKVLLAAGIAREATSVEDLEEKLRLVRGKAGPWGISQAAKKGRPRKSATNRKTEKGVPKRTLRRSSGLPLNLPANPFDEQTVTREARPQYDRMHHGHGSTGLDATSVQDIDWQRLSIRAEFIQPLRGKRIVIFGQLRVMTNEHAIELTRRSGGVAQDQPDEQTDCVVMGGSESNPVNVEPFAGKNQLKILTESQFLELIGL